jgi:hypothetical protein
MMDAQEAESLLKAAGVFFDEEDDAPPHTLNLNDTFCWACADCEHVPDEELGRVADLFHRYGWNGILYWVAQRRGGERLEFEDVRRGIQFVAEEERIRQEAGGDSEYAYAKRSYVIDGHPGKAGKE